MPFMTLCPINVIQRDGFGQPPRGDPIPFYESSTQKLGSSSTIYHGNNVLVPLLADKSYWDMKVLSIMVDFVYEGRTQYCKSTVTARAGTRSVQCGSNQKPSSLASVAAASLSPSCLISTHNNCTCSTLICAFSIWSCSA